ncbi:MAG TPA: glucose 1-dehydrogenase [Polyangiales bacterium]
MKTLAGKTAIVTGASKGIGAGIAKALAAAGAQVVVNYASSKEGAERVVAEIVAKDGKAIAVQGDVARADDIQRLFGEAKRVFGAPSIIVNNAGVFRFATLSEVTELEFHREFDINVLGPLLVSREASKHIGDEGGTIINVSSVVSSGAYPNSVIYSATKAALDSVTRVLARELAPRKIRVNAINPGYTKTEGALELGFSEEQQKEIAAQTPLGRFGEPEDIGKVAVFLASEASSWITGEAIRVAGGVT